MQNLSVSGKILGSGKTTLIKSSSGNGSSIGTTTIVDLSNYNEIMVTYQYGDTSGNLVNVIYPIGLLKNMTTTTEVGESGNYHSITFNVTYNQSSDTLTMVYVRNSRAYNVCIYAIN